MKMIPTARQIARSPLLPVRTLNIGTIDRLSGNSAWAEAIIERYKPAGETDLPSVDFVYQEMSAQEAVESVTELNTLITTINHIRLNANILNQSYMNRYYVSVQERCELLINRLESNMYASRAATSIKEIYRDVVRTEYVPVEDKAFEARMREVVKDAGLPVASAGRAFGGSGMTRSGMTGFRMAGSGMTGFGMARSGMTGSGMARSGMTGLGMVRSGVDRSGVDRPGMNRFGMKTTSRAQRIAQLTGGIRPGSESAGGDSWNAGTSTVSLDAGEQDEYAWDRAEREYARNTAGQEYGRDRAEREYARNTAGQEYGRDTTGTDSSRNMIQLMPMIRDMRFASEWTSQAAKQFFWRVQRAAEAEQEIILQSSGIVSLISLEKLLRPMGDVEFRHFTEELSTRVRTSIEDAASQVVQEERLRTSGIVGRSTAALTGQNEDAELVSGNGQEAVSRTGNETFGMYRGENGQTSEDVGYASASDMPDGMSYGDMTGLGAFPEKILTAIKDGTTDETAHETADETAEYGYPGRKAILAYLKEQSSQEEQDTGAVREYVTRTLRSLNIVEDNRAVAESIAQRIIDMPMPQWNEFREGLSGIMEEYPATRSLLATYFDKVKLIYDRNGLNAPSEDRGGDGVSAPSENRSGDRLNAPSEDRGGDGLTASSENRGGDRLTAPSEDRGGDRTTALSQNRGMDGTDFSHQEDGTGNTGAGSTGAESGRTDESTIRNIRMSAEKSAFLEFLRDIHSDGVSHMLLTEKQILQSGYLGKDTDEELSEIDRLEAAPELTYRSGNIAGDLESLTPEEWHVFTQLLTEARTRSDAGKQNASVTEANVGALAGSGAKAGAGTQEAYRTKADAGHQDASGGTDGEPRMSVDDISGEHQSIAEGIAQGILNMPMAKWTELQDILSGIRTEYPETGNVLDAYFDEVHRIHVSRDVNMPDGNVPDADASGRRMFNGSVPDGGMSEKSVPGPDNVPEDELERNITMSAEKTAFIRLMTGADGGDIYGTLSLEHGILQSGIFGDEDVRGELSVIDQLRSQPELVHRVGSVSNEPAEVNSLETGSRNEPRPGGIRQDGGASSGREDASALINSLISSGSFIQNNILRIGAEGGVSGGASGMGIKEDAWIRANAAADIDNMLSEISQDMDVQMDVRRYVYAGERNIYRSPYNRFMLDETAVRGGAASSAGTGAGAGGRSAGSSVTAHGAGRPAGLGLGESSGRIGAGTSAGASGTGGDHQQGTLGVAQAALEMLRSSRIGIVNESVLSDMRNRAAARAEGAAAGRAEGTTAASVTSGAGAESAIAASTEGNALSSDGAQMVYRDAAYADGIQESDTAQLAGVFRAGGAYGAVASGADTVYQTNMSGAGMAYSVGVSGAGMAYSVGVSGADMAYGAGMAYADGIPGVDMSYAANLPYIPIYSAGGSTEGMSAGGRMDGISPGGQAENMRFIGRTVTMGAAGRAGLAQNGMIGAGAAGSADGGISEPEYADYGTPDIVINASAHGRRDENEDAGLARSSETVQRTQETFNDIEFVTRTQTTQEHVMHEAQTDTKSAMEKLDKHQAEIDKLKASEKQLTRFTDTMTKASIKGDIMRDISSRLRMERLRNGL